MVVGLALAAVQMGMALPTGFLFGVGYGTGVRIGYEQVYPLLFPKGARPTTTELAATMKGMNTVYDAIGGKDASRMGIAVGITNAGEILNNPDFRVLEQLESSSSGPTSSSSSRSRYGLDQESAQEEVSSDIKDFNELTGAEKWARYRTYTITQLQNILSFSSTDESGIIAKQVLFEKFSITYKGPSTSVTKIPATLTSEQLATAKALRENTEWIEWSTKLGKLKALHTAYVKGQVKQQALWHKASGSSQRYIAQSLAQQKNRRRDTWGKIRQMSNDYRHPNNAIRTSALRLRQELASGQWK